MFLSSAIFNSQINQIDELIRKLKMDRERILIKNSFNASDFRNKSYLDNWKEYIRNNLYDFMLFDSSLIIFKNEESNGSYVFFECPYKCLTYEEYCESHNVNIYDDYFEFYLDYLDTCNLKESPVMIRYDYDDSSYINGYHPVSHFHIGFDNNVRIGIERKLNPITFFLFVLRQHYNKKWLELVKSDYYKEKFQSSYIKHKTDNEIVNPKFWNVLDKSELYLT